MTDEITPPSDAAGAGREIAGYLLEEQIGEGGMAVVYRARDKRLGRLVALKLLAPGLAADAGFRQRFINESRAAAAVDHPNIIPIYEAGDAGGSLFIAMRYVQGGDVRSLLEQHGPMSAARAWGIIRQVAAALDAAHAHGLIHRDVKPANMLLDARAAAAAGAARGSPAVRAPEHVYLSDFGISKQPLSAANLTMAGQFVGTLDYIAPEQIGGHLLDGRADLYSLGCAAFELLSGTPPFRRDHDLALVKAHLSEPPPPLTAQRADLAAAVDRVLSGAMAKSPQERYATCAQFATDLGRSLGLVPGEPEPPGTRGRDHSPAGQGHDPGPWPATELAGQAPRPDPVPRPDPGPARDAAPGGQHDVRQPLGQPGLTPATPVYQQTPGGPAWQPQAPAWPPQTPAWPPQAPARRSRGMIAGVIVAAAAIAVAAAAVAVALAGHGRAPQAHSTPPPAASSSSSSSPLSLSPSAEATAISSLLTTGATSSVRLTNAVDNVQACTDLSHSVQQIQQVRDQRQAEYEKARNLSTGALRNGTELKLDLTQSLRYSLDADNDYLAWAQQQVSDCQPGSQSSPAVAAGSQAVSYKTMFVSLWNPIAAGYDLPPTSVGGI